LAHVKTCDSLKGIANAARSKSVFNNDAIKKMGFNPFTGKQFLAAPTQKKDSMKDSDKTAIVDSNVPKIGTETEMIELEIDDED
jgi:hypothetical protein